ncbi:MAG: hypothetical protein ABEJ65_00930 [bacterium]
MKKLTGCIVLLMILIPLSGCGISSDSDKHHSFKCATGQCRIKVPSSWSIQSDLNKSADLQVANRDQRVYLIILSESKEDLADMTLKKHSRLTRSNIVKPLKQSEVNKEKSFTIDGMPALQHKIRGQKGTMNLIYLHTSVKGPENYHQILGWTLPSKWERNQSILNEVINSFEVK